ncbi:MAG: acetyl-CoA C-acetyltransferase [Bacilli bacterium]|nr:acetyl-CoA C-acetyltransferase [Bacilli bacterium]
MKKVFLVDGKRSPIGSFMGSLRTVEAGDLGAVVLKELLDKNNVPKDKIDEVIVGNILPAGAGQGVARQASIKAGVPEEVVAYGINMVCGSGMKSVMSAYANIRAGLHNLVIAGGVESMSNAPFLVSSKIRDGVKMGDFNLVDHMIKDALTDVFSNTHMGITAENIASRYQISREAQDKFAYESQQKAIKAVDCGIFKEEIIPITIKLRKSEFVFENDEYPNRTTTLEKMSNLRPAFKKDGLVTAANSSGINDGSSFVIVASEDAVKQYGFVPKAEIIAIGQGGVDPQYMGMGPVPAIRNALLSAGITLEEIDVLELNEAFSAQSLAVVQELAKEHNLSKEKLLSITNMNGGAIALGHPVGASGNRIIVTLLHQMIRKNAKYGLASLCIGGGMGTAVILKLV